MNRRTFLRAAPALAGAAPNISTTMINIPKLGTGSPSQVFVTTVEAPVPPGNYNWTVPQNMAFEPLCFTCSLLASGAAANRLANFSVTYGGSLYAQFETIVPITATVGKTVVFATAFAAAVNAALTIQIPMGRLVMPPASILSLGHFNIQAGDTMSALRIMGWAYPL